MIIQLQILLHKTSGEYGCVQDNTLYVTDTPTKFYLPQMTIEILAASLTDLIQQELLRTEYILKPCKLQYDVSV